MRARQARALARRAVRRWTYLGRVTVVHALNDYDVQVPGHVDHSGNAVPYVHLRSLSNVEHVVGDWVVVGLHNGNPQLPYIIDAPGAVLPSGSSVYDEWHCVGYDGRRSYALPSASALPPGVASGSAVTAQSWYPGNLGAPLWLDATTRTLGACSKWLRMDDDTAVAVDLPQGYPVGVEEYAIDGVVYTAGSVFQAWDIASRALLWSAPADPGGVTNWGGHCVSTDRAHVFSTAEKGYSTSDPHVWEQELYVRSQQVSDGHVEWRTKVNSTRYLGGRGGARLLYNGPRLFVMYVAGSKDVVQDSIDMSGFSVTNTAYADRPGYDDIRPPRFYQVFPTYRSTLHVAALDASTGEVLWDTAVHGVDEGYAGSSSSVGDMIAVTGDTLGLIYRRFQVPTGSMVDYDRWQDWYGFDWTWRIGGLHDPTGVDPGTVHHYSRVYAVGRLTGAYWEYRYARFDGLTGSVQEVSIDRCNADVLVRLDTDGGWRLTMVPSTTSESDQLLFPLPGRTVATPILVASSVTIAVLQNPYNSVTETQYYEWCDYDPQRPTWIIRVGDPMSRAETLLLFTGTSLGSTITMEHPNPARRYQISSVIFGGPDLAMVLRTEWEGVSTVVKSEIGSLTATGLGASWTDPFRDISAGTQFVHPIIVGGYAYVHAYVPNAVGLRRLG